MTQEQIDKVPFAEVLSKYPQRDGAAAKADALLAGQISKSKRKIIVLDDDPTGVQTVHGISVYTDWTAQSVEAGFDEAGPLFFILTNSRGMTAQESEKTHRDIAREVAAAARKKNASFILISRSDSTLRGHYPLETLTLKNTLEEEGPIRYDGEIICPFFMEGGRYTVGNVHYVKTGDVLVPAAQTEFAADKTFGYAHSDLREWVEEKTAGAYKKESVRAVSIEDLRGAAGEGLDEAVEKITAALMEVSGFNKVIVNALSYTDVKVFAAALYRAQEAGKNFILRSAAALPKVLGGIKDKPLLTREELLVSTLAGTLAGGAGEAAPPGGLVVIGSHVQKTSRQLEILLEKKNIVQIEFDTHLVTDDSKFAQEKSRVQKLADDSIKAGKDTVIYTRRERFDLNTGNKEDELRVSMKIAAAVTGFVSALPCRPKFIIAKGGITSSEIGTVALKVKKALVLGQILPGIPVWLTGSESRFPNTPYIIFPGNVGDEGDLRKIADMLE
ncbi:MAG: hydroxyacid dehydrogenase [Spirochaetes bacterium]|nr:hydroxyacid dehydrogenase [Spirochaetota bacterium]